MAEIYELPERELKRYDQHGMARIDFNEIFPTPFTGTRIPVGDLENPPKYIWLRRKHQMPLVIIASDKVNSIPKNHTEIDPSRPLDEIIVNIYENYPGYKTELSFAYQDSRQTV